MRVEFLGGLFHVTSRGNARGDIFRSDVDRSCFLGVLADVVRIHNWIVHAYCLMDNHYHLLIETPDANLSLGMHGLNGKYTQRFNKAHGRVGHVLQGRFKSFVVEKESYLREVARYIVLNPVRAGMAKHPRDWRWSSYRSTGENAKAPEFLTVDWILGLFGKDRKKAQAKYRKFVSEGKGLPSPFADVEGEHILGTDQFVDAVRELFGAKDEIGEIPRDQRLPNRPSLATIFEGTERSRIERDKSIRFARFNCGYTLTEISVYANIHVSTVSRIAGQA